MRKPYEPGRAQEYRRRTRYGVEPEQFDALKQLQGCKCALCFQPTLLCIDHDHKTGKVRGLLCRACNYKLGVYEGIYFKDQFDAYLKNPPANAIMEASNV